MCNYTYNNYQEKPDPSHRPMYLATALKYLQGGEVSTILDAGCGGGDFAEGLAAHGFKVFGVDLNQSAIEAARKRNCATFTVGSLYESFPERFGLTHFDAIISVETIEHLYSPLTFVQRAAEALRPGGLLIVTTPYWGYLKNIVLAVTGRMDRSLTALWEGGHIKHFSRSTLTQLMEENGFECVAFNGSGHGVRKFIPFIWSGMLMVFRRR